MSPLGGELEIHSLHLETHHRSGQPGDSGESSVCVDRLGGHKVIFHNLRANATHSEFSGALMQYRVLRLSDGAPLSVSEDLIVRDGKVRGYTTKYIDGTPLCDAVGCLGTAGALSVLNDVVSGLSLLHSFDHVHCDLSLSNIIVQRTPAGWKGTIIDMGMLARQGTVRSRQLQGTPGFIAPEIWQAKPITVAADIYSLGSLVRHLVPGIGHARVAAELRRIAADCTAAKPIDRPQSVLQIHDRIIEIANHWPEGQCVIHDPFVALRWSGTSQRAASIERLIRREETTRVVLVGGAPGIGKSSIIRECCIRVQLRGRQTLRLSGGHRIDEIIRALNKTILPARLRGVLGDIATQLSVFIDIPDSRPITTDHLIGLVECAVRLNAVLFLECHRRAPKPLPYGAVYFEMPRVTPDECILATNHLPIGPERSEYIGRSLHISSGGNPGMMTQVLDNGWQKMTRRALNFDYVPPGVEERLRGRFSELSSGSQKTAELVAVFHGRFSVDCIQLALGEDVDVPSCVSELVRAGWVRRNECSNGDSEFAFSGRLARNVVRRIQGEVRLRDSAARLHSLLCLEHSDSLVSRLEMSNLALLSGRCSHLPLPDDFDPELQTLEDLKLSLLVQLKSKPLKRHEDTSRTVHRHRVIAASYARLGYTDRQYRWARRGLAFWDSHRESESLTLELQSDLIGLNDLVGNRQQKEVWLQRELRDTRVLPSQCRGLLLSEKAGCALARGDPQAALPSLYEAEVLFGMMPPRPGDLAALKNRMGIALGLSKKYAAAQDRFQEARDLAQREGDRTLILRSHGNLGWISQLSCDPMSALQSFRSAARYCQQTSSETEYVAILSNQVTCLVDLGQGFRARRTARFAVALAEKLNDPALFAHAANNYGWVMALQGHTREALHWLTLAIQKWTSLGSVEQAFRSKLNIVRLHRITRLFKHSKQMCQTLLTRCREEGWSDLEGECGLEGVRIALAEADVDGAITHASAYQVTESNATAKTQRYARLLSIAIHLQQGNTERARAGLDLMERDSVSRSIHPLRTEELILRGHLAMLCGEWETSLNHLRDASGMASRALRKDLELDSALRRAMLADRLASAPMGLKYIRYILEESERMQAELK